MKTCESRMTGGRKGWAGSTGANVSKAFLITYRRLETTRKLLRTWTLDEF
jgi:hypothetical protein